MLIDKIHVLQSYLAKIYMRITADVQLERSSRSNQLTHSRNYQLLFCFEMSKQC